MSSRHPDASRRFWRVAGLLLVSAVLTAQGACSTWIHNLLGPGGEGPTSTRQLTGWIEEAHGGEAWRRQTVLTAGIELDFSKHEAVEGKLFLETNDRRSRMELKDGTVLVYDGQAALVSPASAPIERARFHLRTWPFFVAAPLWLDRDGKDLGLTGRRFLQGNACDTASLTQNQELDGSPGDSFIFYSDADSHRVCGLVYEVAPGKTPGAADKASHAITYDRFQTINGVTLATAWTFWDWNPEIGIRGDPIGSARLTDIEFITPRADLFSKPTNAREDGPKDNPIVKP